MDDIPTMPRSKAEHVARQLLDRIVTADLSPGSSFGTESELQEQFGVSRPTLRESLRILEAQGVLELRPGPGGGIMMKRPTPDNLARGLSVFLRLNDVPFIEVLKAREVIEPALASEAALNGTEEDFEELAQSIERMKTTTDETAFLEENRVFHSIVARASGNRVLEAFWSTISILATGEHQGVRYTAKNREHVIQAHKGILKACRQRDNRAAAARMESHLVELEYLVRKSYQNVVKQPTGTVSRRSRGPAGK